MSKRRRQPISGVYEKKVTNNSHFKKKQKFFGGQHAFSISLHNYTQDYTDIPKIQPSPCKECFSGIFFCSQRYLGGQGHYFREWGTPSLNFYVNHHAIFFLVMNSKISKIGGILITVSVVLFALFMPFSKFCSYFVCMFLALGYLLVASGLHYESDGENKVAANVGLLFAGIYAVFILLVYFAQTTTVVRSPLNDQSRQILDFSYGGLLFNYDLLGYGMLALSTFFLGLTIKADNTTDKWLKYLMMIHGIFFISCFLLPMTGAFSSMSNGDASLGGTLALELWCVFFLPVGIFSIKHFSKKD